MLHICTLHFDFCKYRSTSKHFLVRVDHCPLRSKQRWVEGFQTRYRSDSSLKLQSKSHYVLIGWMTVLQSNKNYMDKYINVERLPLHSFYCRFLLNWFSLHELHVPYNTSFTTQERSMAKFGRNEGDIDESTTDVPY